MGDPFPVYSFAFLGMLAMSGRWGIEEDQRVSLAVPVGEW
jgi:hypothetical protein